MSRALDALCRFYEWQGLAMEGEAACALGIDSLGQPTAPVEQRLMANLYVWQSMFCRVLSREQDAEVRQRQAIRMLGTLAEAGETVDAERASIYLNLGLSALYQDDLKTVEHVCYESRRLFRAAGDRWGEAQALELLGWSSHNRGRYALCLHRCRKALALRHALGDIRGMAASQMGIGMASARLGHLEEAEQAFKQSIEGWQACNDRRSLAGALSQMASLWTWMGDPEQGCSYSGEAFSILRDLGLPMWLAVEQCTSGFDPYLHSGRYKAARQVLNEGLAIAREQDSPWLLGAGLVRLAKLALVEGDHASEIEALSEALPLLRAVERLDEVADGEITLATSLMLAGELEEARARLTEGIRIAGEIDHYAVRCHGMVTSALLAAVEDGLMLAVERYVSACCEPFVANSQWFADVYGQCIETEALQPLYPTLDTAESASPGALRAAIRQVLAEK